MGFVDRPQNLRWRKILFQLHLWCGLLAGTILLVVGLTGSILVYYHELSEWQAPHVILEPGKSRVNLDTLVDAVRLQYPSWKFRFLYLPEHDQQPLRFEALRDDSQRARYVFVHPQTGKILEQHVDRENFLNWCYRLHMFLLAGDADFTVNAVIALLGVGLTITGAILWWPGVKSWLRAIKVNLRASWKRVNYDLHSSAGFFSAICLALVFLTGAYFRFPEPFVATAVWLTGTPGWEEGPVVEAQKKSRISIEEAVRIAENAIPDATTVYVEIPDQDGGFYYVGRKRESDGLDYAGNGVYINPYDGKILRKELHAELYTPTREILNWIGYIHFGTFGGHATRILWIVLGIVPGLLFITGMLMYWNRSLGKKAQRWRRSRV